MTILSVFLLTICIFQISSLIFCIKKKRRVVDVLSSYKDKSEVEVKKEKDSKTKTNSASASASTAPKSFEKTQTNTEKKTSEKEKNKSVEDDTLDTIESLKTDKDEKTRI
ncbi:unnamed protein product [Caenorhabditis angaria]|uniref:Serpentine receptor class gamma n=1 Tax=Caenorhabditis angaria TaxID=860376 RepID=A0A9P1N3I5_9PELO|nr:unnamed protein product [Caenorhabditis angaria]